MHYAAIFFDLGGVVVDVESDRLMLQVSQLSGKTLDQVQEAVYDKNLMHLFEMGRLTPKQFYEGLKKKLGFSWSYDQFALSWSSIFTEKKDVTTLMGQLRNRYKLYTLSNTNVLHVDWLKRNIPALTLFHEWVTSCETGFRKPDVRIYEIALRQAGIRAHEAIYIDDRPELVEAGAQAGLKAIRFEDSRQLADSLNAIGVGL